MYDTIDFSSNGSAYPQGVSMRAPQNNHYVYWLGQDGNIWVNQNGNTFNIGSPVGNNWQNGFAEGTSFSMGSQGTLIDDPNPVANTSNIDSSADFNSSGYYGLGYGGSSGGSYSASEAAALQKQREAEEKAEKQRQAMISSYNSRIGNTNSQLSDLDGSLKNTLDRIAGEYNTYKNEQESNYNQQKNAYDTSSKQNINSLVSNRNTITDNASKGLRGLQRVLGAMGAGGGSVARYDVPSMVKRQADRENSGAEQTFSENQRNLDTNWGNYGIQYENDKKKLEDWRTGQEKSAKQENEQKRIDLLNQLHQLYSERAQYDYNDPSSDLNSVTDRIKNANQTIKDLGKYTTPSYTGMTATYQAPDLSSYTTGNINLAASVGDNNTSGQSLLTVLQGLNKKKQNENGLGA